MSAAAAAATSAEHSRLVETRIHAFRNSAHTLVFAVCEGADVAHALSSAREHLTQLKLALTASVELGAAAAATSADADERCSACGWLMRFDAVQPGFESVAKTQSMSMAIDGDDNNAIDNGNDASHAVCRRCGGGRTTSTLNDNNHIV